MTDRTDTPPAPVIHPRQVFTVEQARLALGLAETTLDREIRLGRLRCSMRGGRRWVLGEWLLDWIKAGEAERGKRRRCRQQPTA
jgi:hypothetical protein